MDRPFDEFYERITRAVGEVCYWWAAIEHLVQDIAVHTAPLMHTAYEKPTVSIILHIALSNGDIRQTVAAAKAIAADTMMPPEMFDRLESQLNRIDNELRAERNRFVHDLWNLEEGGITRYKRGARVIRPQARRREFVLGTDKLYQSIEEVEAFARTLEQSWGDLAELEGDITTFYGSVAPSLKRAELAAEARKS